MNIRANEDWIHDNLVIDQYLDRIEFAKEFLEREDLDIDFDYLVNFIKFLDKYRRAHPNTLV